jgi:hypothetical protein
MANIVIENIARGGITEQDKIRQDETKTTQENTRQDKITHDTTR